MQLSVLSLICVYPSLSLQVDSGTGQAEVISADSTPVDDTKYTVSERYRLTVNNIAWADEGEYRCTLGVETFRAYMVVSG